MITNSKYDTGISDPFTWVDKYSDQLFRYALTRVSDAEVAKDLVQDVFLSALKNSGSLKSEVAERSWFYSILKNKIIDYYRSKGRNLVTSLDEHASNWDDYFDESDHWTATAAPKEWGVNYGQQIESKEFFEILEKCKGKLSELQNLVFSMKYLDDYDSEFICKELCLSSSNYWVLVHRAKLQIRTCLEKNWFNI